MLDKRGVGHPAAGEEGSTLSPRRSAEAKKEHVGFQLGEGVEGRFWLGPLSLSLGNSM